LKRSEFEHAVRAAGAILQTDKVVVIGSQAVHAYIENLFDEANRSIEVDIAAMSGNQEAAADLIDGSIGELSMFQETFGYYAQGVVSSTAVLPAGWRDRLIPYQSNGTQGVTAYCLEAHDLWVSKAIAGREKDRAFCRAMIELKLVEPVVLRKRIAKVRKIEVVIRERVHGWMNGADGSNS